jgi:shikimate kinase
MKKNDSITLIGMPGVGKSTVGVLLAKRLGFSFMDTDIYIQAHEGRRLQEIIAQIGLSSFCDLEEKYMLSISGHGNVIATGGSVVYRDRAMQHLKSMSIVAHLDLDAKNLEKRLENMDARGVVRKPGQSLEGLYNERHPLYLRYADFTVDCLGLTAEQVMEKLFTDLSFQR